MFESLSLPEMTSVKVACNYILIFRSDIIRLVKAIGEFVMQ